MGNEIDYVKILEEKGFTRESAEVQLKVIKETIMDNAATKKDISDLNTSIRKDMKDLGTELRKEMKNMDSDLRTDMNNLGVELRKEMKDLGTDLRQEMKDLGTDLRKEMKDLDKNISHEIGRVEKMVIENTNNIILLRNDMGHLETRIINKVGGLIIGSTTFLTAVIGIAGAILKYAK